MFTPSLVNQAALLALAAILVMAAAEDVRRLIIPNRLCLAILILFPLHALNAPYPVDWLAAAGVMGAVLVAGLLLFSIGFVGGGDVKLFAAASLWAGPGLFPVLLLVTAITGGVVAGAMLTHRYFTRPRAAVAEPMSGPRRGPGLARRISDGAMLANSALLSGMLLMQRHLNHARPAAEAFPLGAPQGVEAGGADRDYAPPPAPPRRDLPYGVAIAAGGLQVAVMLFAKG